jgi:uncharacterized protein (TIGR03435 family)
VDAKADGNPSIPEMIGPMLAAVLADRGRLKVHRETKQLPVYILTAAKGALKLPERATVATSRSGRAASTEPHHHR